jgi:hypothetical protein
MNPLFQALLKRSITADSSSSTSCPLGTREFRRRSTLATDIVSAGEGIEEEEDNDRLEVNADDEGADEAIRGDDGGEHDRQRHKTTPQHAGQRHLSGNRGERAQERRLTRYLISLCDISKTSISSNNGILNYRYRDVDIEISRC